MQLRIENVIIQKVQIKDKIVNKSEKIIIKDYKLSNKGNVMLIIKMIERFLNRKMDLITTEKSETHLQHEHRVHFPYVFG